jgi:hypothetical protein
MTRPPENSTHTLPPGTAIGIRPDLEGRARDDHNNARGWFQFGGALQARLDFLCKRGKLPLSEGRLRRWNRCVSAALRKGGGGTSQTRSDTRVLPQFSHSRTRRRVGQKL